MQNTDDYILISGLSVNPFHNLVHLAIGGFLIIMSRQATATAEGACLGVGTFYVAAFVIGVVGESNLTIISMFGRDDLENFNHLINGVLLLGIGLVSSAATESEPKRTGIPASLASAPLASTASMRAAAAAAGTGEPPRRRRRCAVRPHCRGGRSPEGLPAQARRAGDA